MMAQFRKQLFSSGRLPYRFKTLPITLFLCALLSALGLSWGTADGAMDLADEPMLAKFKAAPANIMFLLDDSGSMTFEVLVAGYSDGNFPNLRLPGRQCCQGCIGQLGKVPVHEL